MYLYSLKNQLDQLTKELAVERNVNKSNEVCS